jgi:hypothetical protein
MVPLLAHLSIGRKTPYISCCMNATFSLLGLEAYHRESASALTPSSCYSDQLQRATCQPPRPALVKMRPTEVIGASNAYRFVSLLASIRLDRRCFMSRDAHHVLRCTGKTTFINPLSHDCPSDVLIEKNASGFPSSPKRSVFQFSHPLSYRTVALDSQLSSGAAPLPPDQPCFFPQPHATDAGIMPLI